jgi:putative hydrolase of the HAD superfamily
VDRPPAQAGDAAEGDLRAVLWDFGGVLTTSPFDAFLAYERANSLPTGFIRGLNATNSDTNAWARFERSELDVDDFAASFEAEASAAGGRVDARELLAVLRTGELRPAMVEAARRCHERFRTGLLTNNFAPGTTEESASGYDLVFEHFDLVLESSKAGFRKPDPRFYQSACEQLGIRPDEAVFLDDLGVNLKPARAMGMRTIKVVDPAEALAELETIVGFGLG